MAEVATPPPAPTGAVGASTVTRLLPGDLSFQTVLDFACSVQRARGPGSQARKEAMVQGFIRDNIARESRRAWEVFRLLLPHLDMHRPPCMLQEARLGTFLLQAAAIPEGSERWRRVKGWIDPLLADKHTVGQFAEVLCKCLFNEHCAVVPGTPQSRQLKVAHVNELLDRLSAASGNTDLVVPLLRELYQRTTPQQLKHLVQIIQRDHRIQLGEAYIFPRWHPDAAACYAHCCDARQVFNGLCDPAVTFQAGLELGSCAQPQLSLPMYSSRALVENMQRLEAKSREALAAQPAPAEAAVAGAATGGCNGSGIGRGGGSGRPSDGGKGGAQGPATIAGQQAGTVQFLVEIKLDGERQQIHMPADPSQPCNYFSRRGIDHGPELERQGGGRFRCFDPVVRAQVRARDVILDGELLSWNRSRRRFEVFGSWRSMVRALNEGAMPSDLLDCADYDGNLNVGGADWEAPMLQDLEACYVCWDILWADGKPLAQLPLLERHRLLRQAVSPAPPEGIPLVPTRPSAPRRGALRGRIVLLLPGEAIFPGVPVPRVCSTVPEVDAAIREAMTLGLEGIVAKRLGSPWTAGDRSGNWVKFKPDYVDRVDLDGVIIGVWHGERERSGKYGEFLLGIRCRRLRGSGSAGQAGSGTGGNGDGDDDGGRGEGGGSSGRGAASQTWASFVKVGAGLRMAELERLTALLEPHTCQQPPSCYQLTGHYKERPHLYIRNPLDSIVLEVQADLRLTCSCYYASEYSLRFPRVERIRWDKGALQASDEEELRIRARSRKEQMVQEELRCMLQLGQGARLWSPCKTRKALASEAPRRRGRLALGACPATVKAQSSALSGCCLFILDYLGHDQQHCQKLVRQLGGSIWSVATFEPARVGSSYTHVLAGAPLPAPGVRPKGCEAKNWRLVAGAGCDVLSLGWLASCFAAGRLVEPAAADYLQLSAATLRGHPSWDAFGDDYFRRATVEDVAAALLRMPAAEVLEDRGALEGWLDGRREQAAVLTQQQEAGGSGDAGGSDGGQDEVTVLEGERLLLRRIPALAVGQPGGARRAAELAAEVDAELAALGLLDASALMHGCRVAVLPLLLGAERQLQLQGRSMMAADSWPASSAATGCPSLLAGVARLQAETQQCRARLVGYAASSLAGLVAVHGGSVSSSVDDNTTHLLVVQPPTEPCPAARAAVAQLATALAAAAEVAQAAVEQAAKADERLAEHRAALLAAATQAAASCAQMPVEPADLLAAVSRQAGGQAAVAALRRRLELGQLALVAPSWVETSVEAAAQRAGLPLPPVNEREHAPPLASGSANAAAGPLTWPWELYAAASPLATAGDEESTSRAEIEQAEEEAVQARAAQASSGVRAQRAASAQEPALAASADEAEEACRNEQLEAVQGAHCAAHGPCGAGGVGVPCSGPAAALTTAAAAMVGAAVANIPRVAAAAAVAPASPASPVASKPAPLLSPPPAPASRPGADRQPARQAASLPGPGLQVCPPAERVQQAKLASRPRLAPAEQQPSKRRRIICFGLPREQQARRRRPLFQQGPSELRKSEPEDGRKRSQCLQPAQHEQRAQGAVPLMSARQAASAPALAPALPSMFDMLFGRHQPSQGCEAAGAAGWEVSAPATQQQVPPIAFPPASATKAAPASTSQGASYSASHSSSHSVVARHGIGEPRTRAAAPQQSYQDAGQEHVPQGAAALASGSQDRVQAHPAVGQGLRGRMATLRALSQQQEEERTRREVAEASQG